MDMNLNTKPNFNNSTRSFTLTEVRTLLGVSSQSLDELATGNILCRSYILNSNSEDETLFHSIWDILATHLYLTVATKTEGAPTRHLLSFLAVSSCLEILRQMEFEQPPSSPTKIMETIGNNKILITTDLARYRKELAQEIILFWTKLNNQLLWSDNENTDFRQVPNRIVFATGRHNQL